MEIIIAVIWAFAACLCVYQITRIGLTITHKQVIVPPVYVKEEVDKDEEEQKMKDNALNIMKKFNQEWSGLDGE